MEQTGFFRLQPSRHHHLDPSAQEFFPPAPPPPPFLTPPPPPPPIYYLPPFCDYSAPHLAFFITGPVQLPPPQLQLPPAPVIIKPYIPPPILTPSRALLLSQIPSDVSESTLRRDLEVFGDVRAVQMDRIHDGIVTVHFYDLRQAQKALLGIQEQHMQNQARRVGRHQYHEAVLSHNCCQVSPPPPPPPTAAYGHVSGRAVWAQFTIPMISKIPDGTNQGTLVIFNLDPLVSPVTLKQIFQKFGHVRELRDTPSKKYQRFVEFYDTRDATKALAEMKGKEINGRKILIEFSRPGGFSKRLAKSNKNYQSNCYPPSHISPPPQAPFSCRSMSPTSSFPINPSENHCGSIQDSLASLCIDKVENGYEESCKMKSTTKKWSKKGNNNCTSSSSTKEHHIVKIKPWKSSRLGKEYDRRFLINEDAIMESSNCNDSRTTVMIKNIPNKYSQKLLLNMLDNHCIRCNEQIADGDDQPLSSYDFVYLPIDFMNKCNVGYGFVNMTSPEATLRIYKAFHHETWEVFNSRKICEVTYARLQGVEALREHFKNSKFPCDADEYMPVTFSPPRDGRQLTEPVPIVSRSSTYPLSSSNGGDNGGDYYDNNGDMENRREQKDQ
ncbi:RNA metabolism protein [Lithospermum erythrorhizon]|uniref:RNA metabolism protein n=1 Tax=Lithospermum erythrorhizon TaxID=34254 RepID=A0AAV3PTZ4_LITER